MKRAVLIIVLLALAAGGGYLGWKYYFTETETVDALKLVPEDAVFIVETDEPVEAWQTFSSSPMWQHIKNYKPLGDIGKMADGLSQIIDENQLIFNAFGSRKVLISAHVVSATDYDFLYVCDMKKSAKFDVVKEGIIGLLKNNGLEYSTETAGEHTVHRFRDPADKSVLHIAFVGNQLVCSYNSGIIKNSLSGSKGSMAASKHFSAITQKTPGGGLCRIYLNHTQVPKYLDVYMDDVSGMKGLFSSMHHTGAFAEVSPEMVGFKGFTSINDSMSSHLRALAKSGKAATKAQTVLSEKTAFTLSMGFQSFQKFYANLTDVLKQDALKWNEWDANRRMVEKYLGFSMEEDLLGWIDNEVTVAQYEQERVIGGKVHTVIAMKAVTIDKAREKLTEIEKRIKRRTPLKFKTASYKEHDVHYLEIKGLFKLLFGKLFGKIEKPYFTYLDDYVVFCDDAATLLKTIDDFEDGKTLEKTETYQAFAGNFKNESSMFTWLNMKKYFLNMKGILDAGSYQTSYTNREYILCFPQMGFQLTEDEGMFDTRLMVQFKKPAEEDMKITEAKPLSIEEIEEADSLSEADAFILEYVNGNARREMYDNGKVKFIAETKNDELHGRYIEYWENGAVKVKGRYKNGEKSGKWKYYKQDGDLERRERFGRRREAETDSM
ncbi:MAG: DUF3352 domain-containing protein [Bacteroidetes bacterium]|nr:DUF3352 domain-containing protein [Bacteroidota bacterium]